MVVNLLTNSSVANLAQSTTFQIGTEGVLKSVARPAYILGDTHATMEERKYAATREFLRQSISIGLYFVAIIPFTLLSYKFLRKMDKGVKGLKDAENLDTFNKLAKKNAQKIADALKEKSEGTPIPKEINDIIQTKGKMQAMEIAGSCLFIAMLLPQFVNKIVHPVMHWADKNILHTGKKHKHQKEPEFKQPEKLDVAA